MRFLIDGHRDRVTFRSLQWREGVIGQLLTPLTRYSRGHSIFAIDNGAFTRFREKEFISLLKRESANKNTCLFVCAPDKLGCHKTTVEYWHDNKHLTEGWKRAFVAQDGFDGMPDDADALFIGGTDKFKDSSESLQAVKYALYHNKHVHIGRVNTAKRFVLYAEHGAHTCDGSGVSRYDHMLPAIRDFIVNSR